MMIGYGHWKLAFYALSLFLVNILLPNFPSLCAIYVTLCYKTKKM